VTSLRLRNVHVDAPPGREDEVTAFWAGALGATTRPGIGPYTHLVGAASPVGVHVQRLDAGPARYHLDLEADDPEAEVARLLDLGGTPGEGGDTGIVVEDPAGILACVCPTGAVVEDLGPVRPESARLHFVVLDLPADRHDATVAFWEAAFGLEARPAGARFPAYRFLGEAPTTAGGVGVLLQDVGDGPARIHLDLHVGDPATRDAEVARLAGLGATRVWAHAHWVTLADPTGNLLCVVPDRADS
jgi:predicted enzyme related to lactoylglutathione lyase